MDKKNKFSETGSFPTNLNTGSSAAQGVVHYLTGSVVYTASNNTTSQMFHKQLLTNGTMK